MRIALGVEYNGFSFCGWQKQKPEYETASKSIQTHLEGALSKIADQPISTICAGRTDSGVHALQQVVHFDTDVEREHDSWLLGGNTFMPPEIRIKWVRIFSEPEQQNFHARFSAQSRRYRYIIHNDPRRSAILNHFVTWERLPLDHNVMNEAARYLVGEHDFTSFRASGCQANSANRNVMALKVNRSGNFVIIDITANAFLYHMVRNIAGTLLKIGFGERPPIWAKEVLQTRDRAVAGVTAPGAGLYFITPNYPDAFGIPECDEQLSIISEQ